MNFVRKMKKLQHNAKALSPVVASIILIAVTVAVSIAVAAWMGGLSSSFMQTEQASITNVQFTADSGNDLIYITISNTGANDITINTATLNGATATSTNATMVLNKNTANNLIILDADWDAGSTYQIKLVSAKGTNFPYSAVAQ